MKVMKGKKCQNFRRHGRKFCLPCFKGNECSVRREARCDHRNMADDDNWWYEEQGRKTSRRMGPPTGQELSRGKLWTTTQYDLTVPFLSSLHAQTMVITCKDGRVPAVDAACAEAGLNAPILFNIGYWNDRSDHFWELMQDVADLLHAGIDVVVHCHAGCHRGALCAAIIRMFIEGRRFEECKELLRQLRPRIEIDSIQYPQLVYDKRTRKKKWTQNNDVWIREYERYAVSDRNPFIDAFRIREYEITSAPVAQLTRVSQSAPASASASASAHFSASASSSLVLQAPPLVAPDDIIPDDDITLRSLMRLASEAQRKFFAEEVA